MARPPVRKPWFQEPDFTPADGYQGQSSLEDTQETVSSFAISSSRLLTWRSDERHCSLRSPHLKHWVKAKRST